MFSFCNRVWSCSLVLVTFLVFKTDHVWGNSLQNESSKLVQLKTDLGDITIEVYLDKAPLSAGDFVKYVELGLYKGEGFYRVVRPDNDQGKPLINVIQGGILDEKEGLPPVAHESTDKTGILHKRGVVSLARLEVGTGSAAYFFIVVQDAPALDYGKGRNPDKQGFAAFGRVIKGMKVVDAIHQIKPSKLSGEDYMKGQMLKAPIKILSAKVLQ